MCTRSIRNNYIRRLVKDLLLEVLPYAPQTIEEVRGCCGAWAAERLLHLAEPERTQVIAEAVAVLALRPEGKPHSGESE